jgi:hypothetical protein
MRVDSIVSTALQLGHLFVSISFNEFINLHPASTDTDDKFSNLDSGKDTAGSEQVPTIS